MFLNLFAKHWPIWTKIGQKQGKESRFLTLCEDPSELLREMNVLLTLSWFYHQTFYFLFNQNSNQDWGQAYKQLLPSGKLKGEEQHTSPKRDECKAVWADQGRLLACAHSLLKKGQCIQHCKHIVHEIYTVNDSSRVKHDGSNSTSVAKFQFHSLWKNCMSCPSSLHILSQCF